MGLILFGIILCVPIMVGLSSGAEKGWQAFFVILLLYFLGFGALSIFAGS